MAKHINNTTLGEVTLGGVVWMVATGKLSAA